MEQKNSSKNSLFVSTKLDQVITRYATPLISHMNNRWAVYGTCVIITPGLAITARHVIEGLLNDLGNVKVDYSIEQDQNLEIPLISYIIQIFNSNTAFRWKVIKYYFSNMSDICYLKLKPMFDFDKLPVKGILSMTLIPPKIGDRIVGFGFPNSDISVKGYEITTTLDPITTVGEVIEVHSKGRDQRLSFPVFRTNARFDGGMSGGPVFTNDGKLCGLICSNMPPLEPDQDHISYVTLLWPSMNTEVELDLKHHSFKKSSHILFLAEHKYLQIEGWENIRIKSTNVVTFKNYTNIAV